MPAVVKLLRIYTDELAFTADRRSLEVIASRALKEALGGVTVLEAMLGFGASAHVHRRNVLDSDRSVVIEIVDEEARLRAFVSSLEDITGIGLITLEDVEVLFRAEWAAAGQP